MAIIDEGTSGVTYVPTDTRMSMTLAYTKSASAKSMYVIYAGSGNPDIDTCIVEGETGVMIDFTDYTNNRMVAWRVDTSAIPASGTITVSAPASDPNKAILAYITTDEVLSVIDPNPLISEFDISLPGFTVVPSTGDGIAIQCNRSTSAGSMSGPVEFIHEVDGGASGDLSYWAYRIPAGQSGSVATSQSSAGGAFGQNAQVTALLFP